MAFAGSYLKFGRGLLLSFCFCSFTSIPALKAEGFTGQGGNTGMEAISGVVSGKEDSISYENYMRMLDEEAKIPLSEIPEDTAPEYLKERVRALMIQYGNNRQAFAAIRESFRVKPNAMAMAELKRNAGLRNTNVADLEGVYSYFDDQGLKLIDEIGTKNFIHRYIAITPKLSHVKVLREAKLREFMDKEDHIRYFQKLVLPGLLCVENGVVEKDEFKGFYYLRMPIFTRGTVIQWIRENVRYPVEAIERNLQAKIFVSYVVDTDGSVTDVRIAKGSVLCLNEEALRVVKSFPDYIPAWCPVQKCNRRVAYTVPISFRLQSPGDIPVRRKEQVR